MRGYQKLSNLLYLPLVMKAIGMPTVSAPTIRMYGGVHDDPGSRQRFLEELAKRETVPHFVAVEWEQSVFTQLSAWRSRIKEGLSSHWGFLTLEDCHELSCALAWEGDASTERFPDTDRLWLETGFQERYLQQQARDSDTVPDKVLENQANCLLKFMTEIPPPEPTSKKELIDRVWRERWSKAWSMPGDFDRDARWATMIFERSAGLRDGWIAVVGGWQHANPQEDHQRLLGLLRARGFGVNSVCLGP